ncbi:hypothetical protein [Frankia nepalensis]|uniref:Uncharacterized protein n=1 Tax=Frankia nepalensis TaxID=1836974 RepID=A0A937RTW2_9ACTN|nr:hypothetical protein [Frankia nepalensis]MBL7500161.1 hypothetical protein [Frankia nepalensis]MBL7512392.1 hypothetical protein [Frankia nepalensis]MBL7632708.1 hypothetical protein [Frankia nepalensis]
MALLMSAAGALCAADVAKGQPAGGGPVVAAGSTVGFTLVGAGGRGDTGSVVVGVVVGGGFGSRGTEPAGPPEAGVAEGAGAVAGPAGPAGPAGAGARPTEQGDWLPFTGMMPPVLVALGALLLCGLGIILISVAAPRPATPDAGRRRGGTRVRPRAGRHRP